jgi:hypothetical protein
MSRLRPKAVLLVLLSLPLSSVPAVAYGAHNQRWQEGEILSRKTVAPGHHNLRTRYVYRIKSGSVQYVARFDQPLSLAPYTPLMFSVVHKHLFVRDANGSELKASILKRAEPGIRR